MSEPKADLEALAALQADIPGLGRIEAHLDRFNVFETIGFVDQELMHSRFLAFLLDPKQNHGVDGLFLKGVLRKALSSNAPLLPVLLDDLGGMDLNETLVRREHQHVDVLLTNEEHRFAVIVENKVWTVEHSGQLHRYYQLVKKDYPSWDILGIYLTPYGASPSHQAYVPLGYGAVCEVLDEVLEERGTSLVPQVRVAVEHYADMIRRRILGDPELVSLCQRLYHRHKRAFDLVFEHRPDVQGTTRDLLVHQIRTTDGLTYRGRYRNVYVYFYPEKWDVPALNAGDDRHGFLRFVFHNHSGELTLYLETSWGNEDARQKLFRMGRENEATFNNLVDPKTDSHPKLYSRAFLTPESYEDASDREREQEIRRQWAAFLEEDLPKINAILKEEAWIWDSVEADA